ncbi:alpha/beta hydrolase [Halorarius litoreus]|uniref:alpha/beta hydrolase n=1 Tax=Halorarius litoreus TaxID=2962676 RepID=UPI0020CEE514|nr:phospholipase [Halorarius litoreus]
MSPPADPHADGELLTAGAPPEVAKAAVVLLHGRGDSASNLLRLADEFYQRGVLLLAPEAEGRRWFPWSPAAPLDDQEPWRSSAVGAVERALDVAADAGIAADRCVLFGFSQGAALAGEVAVSRPRRYGGIAMLAGGLLGDIPGRAFTGSLDGTPAFLGVGDDDPNVSLDRVSASAAALESLDASVTHRVYDGLGHAINDDEVAVVDGLVAGLLD